MEKQLKTKDQQVVQVVPTCIYSFDSSKAAESYGAIYCANKYGNEKVVKILKDACENHGMYYKECPSNYTIEETGDTCSCLQLNNGYTYEVIVKCSSRKK
ncbi:MAG: hypothetical protein IJK66_02400 [Bacilli bacterium]|nr:hypothetical protein [Bacilli bacterium]